MAKGGRQFVLTYGLNEFRLDLYCLKTARKLAAFMSRQGELVEVHCLRTNTVIFFRDGDETGTKQLLLQRYHNSWHSSRRK